MVLFFVQYGFAQVDSAGLKTAMYKLDKALIGKEPAVLNTILHPELSYGHSNGWIQDKRAVIDDCKSGKLVYSKIGNENITINSISKERANVSMKTDAEGMANGNPFNLTLHVMQVWIRTENGWQLLARQSAKQ